MAPSTGSPASSDENATPHSSAGIQEPMAIPRSHRARQRGSSIFPRHSMATIRTIMDTRINSSGR
ncbi:Uncharacterised protein [Mycobacteroides abscessus subsp. abscessus]|nr:Uncharacterised protein [Mycobacteroides abscessus subsp. abscessus]